MRCASPRRLGDHRGLQPQRVRRLTVGERVERPTERCQHPVADVRVGGQPVERGEGGPEVAGRLVEGQPPHRRVARLQARAQHPRGIAQFPGGGVVGGDLVEVGQRDPVARRAPHRRASAAGPGGCSTGRRAPCRAPARGRTRTGRRSPRARRRRRSPRPAPRRWRRCRCRRRLARSTRRTPARTRRRRRGPARAAGPSTARRRRTTARTSSGTPAVPNSAAVAHVPSSCWIVATWSRWSRSAPRKNGLPSVCRQRWRANWSGGG